MKGAYATMEYANIIYTVDNGIATIKLNRPKALNALNSEINADIMAAINEVKADPSVRVLIMTGSERAFAAGADVKEMAEATPRYAREFCGLAIEINNILESLPIPTIAAVGGFAFGGGCEMTLACDFRVGGSRTTLSFPEVGLGIIPGANGCARATAIVGPAKAKQLVMLTENEQKTIALGIAALQSSDSTDYGLIMAGAALAAVPIIIIFLIFQKYFTQGITMGAVKG